jgi:hypothetical protein
MLFKEIIVVYSDNHAKPINTKCSITYCQSEILLPLPGVEPRSPGPAARSQTLYWLSYPAHLSGRKEKCGAVIGRFTAQVSRTWASDGHSPGSLGEEIS